MNNTSILLLSVCLTAGVSAATTYVLLPPDAAMASSPSASEAELGRLQSEIMRLGQELEAVRAMAPAKQLPAARGVARISDEAVERAVRRYFEEQGGGPELAANVAPQEPAAGTVKVADVLAKLRAGGLNEEQRVELWKQLREAGKLDEAIANYEAEAEANPNDPDAQVAAAQAYLQKIFEVGDGPEAGLWATKADAAYDRALELNPEHWDARFNKAISLSFWPPIFGKQVEAISQFEQLIGQQQSGPIEERHAHSYILLGNLYAQNGQLEKAHGVWQQGLTAFPDNLDLLGKLGD